MNLLRSIFVFKEEILWIAASLDCVGVIKNLLLDQNKVQ